MNDAKFYKSNDIAVIGVGLHIANAQDLEGYWAIFDNNLDCIRSFPQNRQEQVRPYVGLYTNEDNPSFYNANYLEHVDEFDYEFFNLSPKEAQLMDPVHRIVLQTIYESFDNAGYSAEALSGTKTGIFLGYTSASQKDNYVTNIAFCHPDLMQYAMVGNMAAVIPSRISQLLNLCGPTMLIDTACSSSLVAVHQACESIRSGTSSMAVAGGIKLNMIPIILESLQIGIEAVDNHTRAFDDHAGGAANGEGVACVLLKPLQQAQIDGDHIYAVVKGSAINHDGRSSSLTAPNAEAQARVLRDAWENAKIDPANISYIETHGTGTVLGDPIEIQGLVKAFAGQTRKKQFCALSAGKSNIGHLNECAGIASFIKMVCALQHKKIPGMRNFNVPNTKIDFCNSPFYINTKTKNWNIQNGIRLGGVSAFGLSGTNCHVVLEEYLNDSLDTQSETPISSLGLLAFSAKSTYSLKQLAVSYYDYLKHASSDKQSFIIANINAYRTQYPLKAAIQYSSYEQLLHRLEILSECELELWKRQSGVFCNLEPVAHFIKPDRHVSELIRSANLMLLGNTYEKQVFLELADLYTKGVFINWTDLYAGINTKKLPLPSYPFKKNRLWLPVEEAVLPAFTKKVNQMSPPEDIYYQHEFWQEDILYDETISEESTCLVITDHTDTCLLYTSRCV